AQLGDQRIDISRSDLPGEPERGDPSNHRGIIRRLDLDALQLARPRHPVVTKVAIALFLRCWSDLLMERQGSRYGEVGREIRRARMNARTHVIRGEILIAQMPVDIGDAVLADVHEADTERRADPLMQIEADEIDAEIRRLKFDLPPAVSSIENDIDATRL